MSCVVYLKNNMKQPELQTSAEQLKLCLLNVAQHQDRGQFLQIYDHFAPRLKHFLVKRGAGESMAEELAQETMLSVWRHCGSYNPEKATASTWIFRIARNLWVDRLRKDKPDRITSLEMYPEAGFTPGLAELDSDHLKMALKNLPPQQAQLVYRVYFEGKTHREISDEMDIPLGSVKSGLRLALGKLRNRMGGES